MQLDVKITSNRAAVEEASTEAIARALEAIGLQAEGYAKMLCPVDTGILRKRLTHEVDTSAQAVQIGTNVEYGKYVEYGTSRMAAQPYLQPAVYDNLDEYAAMAEHFLKEE